MVVYEAICHVVLQNSDRSRKVDGGRLSVQVPRENLSNFFFFAVQGTSGPIETSAVLS